MHQRFSLEAFMDRQLTILQAVAEDVDLVRGLPPADDRDAQWALAATPETQSAAVSLGAHSANCHGDARCFEANDQEGTHRSCRGEYAHSLGKPILVQGKT